MPRHFGTGFEGGMRALALIHRPGKIAAGTVIDEMLSASDWKCSRRISPVRV